MRKDSGFSAFEVAVSLAIMAVMAAGLPAQRRHQQSGG
jgi:prepilin-type N-terminal cleavage/methylation domain-containing protein